MVVRSLFLRFIAPLPLLFGSGCVFAPLNPDYAGPKARSLELNEYYAPNGSYLNYSEELLSVEDDFTVKRITLETSYGPVKVDYFARHKRSDDLVFVFPVLGGKNIIENHFARYFAARGFDTAIVHRNGEFKHPENFERLETLFKENVIRDRITMDFFESVYQKRDFGSFGISRGAMNVAMTAGVDERMKYNVLALGGAGLTEIFRDSTERGVKKFRKKVMASRNMNEEEFYAYLKSELHTTPEALASHIDARNTLMILAVFDTTVPFRYGVRLRNKIGRPETVFLAAGHYTSLLFTQFVKLVPPDEIFCIFPFDYIETESLAFYRRSFVGKSTLKEIPFNILQFPFNLLSRFLEAVF